VRKKERLLLFVKRTLPPAAWVMAMLFLPVSATADGLTGFIDYTFDTVSTKTTDASGQSVRTESKDFLQRYSFLYQQTIFPKLKFEAAGVFERDLTKLKTDGVEVDSSNTRFRPYATLTIRDPMYTAGVGYYLREEKVDTSLTRATITEKEDYDAIFGWKPEGLPAIDARYTRTNIFDRDRTLVNSVKDYASLASRYAVKGFDFSYFGTYSDTKDKLIGQETVDAVHNARAAFSSSFLNGRANLNTSYNIIRDTVTVSSTGAGGSVQTEVFPFAGYSSVNDTPTIGALTANSALIDRNLTAGAGINIGLPAAGADTSRRNIGADFLTPATANELWVWVDRELPQAIADSFSWDVYTSADNFNWSFLTTVFPATFGPFQNRFDITFQEVITRYIKVVVRPLQATVTDATKFPEIVVTEIQAFLKRAVTGSERESFTSTSQISSTDFRYRITDRPLLFYESSYFLSKRDTGTQEISTLSNGISSARETRGRRRYRPFPTGFRRPISLRAFLPRPAGSRGRTARSWARNGPPISTMRPFSPHPSRRSRAASSTAGGTRRSAGNRDRATRSFSTAPPSFTRASTSISVEA
jgi:hypothetical protein